MLFSPDADIAVDARALAQALALRLIHEDGLVLLDAGVPRELAYPLQLPASLQRILLSHPTRMPQPPRLGFAWVNCQWRTTGRFRYASLRS